MGDYTRTVVVCRIEDAHLFGADPDEFDEDDIVALVEDDEGDAEMFMSSSVPSVPFYGFHGSGDDYGPGLFANDGKEYWHVDCDYEGIPLAAVTRDGAVGVELQAIRSFFQTFDRALTALPEHEVPKEMKYVDNQSDLAEGR